MSSLAELDHAIAACDPKRREEKLARLTRAFLEIAPRLSEKHVTLFDHVMYGLGRVSGDDARAALALAITPVPNAPIETTRRLALDHVARVAAPILKMSSRVDADTLVEVATERGVEHLLALASRATLEASWAEPLARRGGRHVLSVLASNPTVGTMPAIVALIASGGLAVASPTPDEVREAKVRAGREAAIVSAAEAARWDEVAGIVADIAGIQVDPVSVAVHSPEIDPLLICLRAAELDWEVAQPVITSRLGTSVTSALMAEAAATYARLTPEAARRATQVLLVCARMHPSRAA